MAIEVKVPLLPESVSDATVSTWHKKVGDAVSRDENLVDLETDKVMIEVPSPSDGVIKEILHQPGDTVQAQTVLAVIDEAAQQKQAATSKSEAPKTEAKAEVQPQPSTAPQKSVPPAASPSVRRLAEEKSVNLESITGTGKGGRVTKENVIAATTKGFDAQSSPKKEMAFVGDRPEKRVPMTRLRARIAERLLEVSQNTAMLTTFNEINMQAVSDLRKKYRDTFEKKHHTRLGFMSFFVKAVVEALKRSPIVNASIDGNDIVYHGFYDIGVAVSTDRGLVVPVLRDVDQMSMADIEMSIADYAERARTGKLTLEEMQGGTFTITNGGVFGSLMATPLLNAPQCAILGMHKIQDRPIVENGQIVIRPMMYIALSYDHRLIDGKESVTFLVSIKELLEDPSRLLLEV